MFVIEYHLPKTILPSAVLFKYEVTKIIVYNKMLRKLLFLFLFFWIFGCSESKRNSSEIYFGWYCGECDRNCSLIIKLNHKEAFVDTSRTFFDWHFNQDSVARYIFPETLAFRLSDSTHAKISNLFHILPTNLDSSTTEIGCPDCFDHCGIYYSTQNNHWEIDPSYDGDLAMFIDSARAFSWLVRNEVTKKR